MTGTPINLNRARKQRARTARRAAADRNATLHGLTKAQKATARAEAGRTARTHEALRRDDAPTPSPNDSPTDGNPTDDR